MAGLDGTHQLIHHLLQRLDLTGQMQVALAESFRSAVQRVLHSVFQHLQLFLGILGELYVLGVHLIGRFEQVDRMVADALKIADGVEQGVDALAVSVVQLPAG